MRSRVWFVVPVFGRFELTRVCLRQLARTCEAVEEYEIEATAIVIGDDANLEVAEELGFGTVERDNSQLGRKFNDGYQLACDPEVNPSPADYVVPCGSDDWIDPVIFKLLPGPSRIGIFRQIAVVDEKRQEIARLRVGYNGGAGIRIIPRQFIEMCGYRPADEDRRRAIDTSCLEGIKRFTGLYPQMVDLDVHEFQIVDWKTRGTQLNSYRALAGYRRGQSRDPFDVLAEFYPSEALDEMRSLEAVPV